MTKNDGDPDLIQAVIENIQAWRNECHYPATFYTNRRLCQAIRQQDDIGWQSFIEGFTATGWRKTQEEHLLQIGSQKSALLWMSRLSQKLWSIMRAMWTDRNDTLHQNGNSVHQQESRAITTEILMEWQTGLDLLPQQRYEHLFRGTVQDKLRENIVQKQMWLCSVWGARDRYGSTQERGRDIVASDCYRRWKEKLQYQKYNKLVNEEIMAEWMLGIHTLNPSQWGHLFSGTLQGCLSKKLHVKKRWICRVWQARDEEGNGNPRPRNPHLVGIYDRWRAQNDED